MYLFIATCLLHPPPTRSRDLFFCLSPLFSLFFTSHILLRLDPDRRGRASLSGFCRARASQRVLFGCLAVASCQTLLFFFYLIVQPAVWLLGRRGGLSGRQRLSCGWTWLIPCARVVCLFACSANRQPANLPACYTVSGASRPVFAARAAAAFLNHTLTCPPPPARTSPRH